LVATNPWAASALDVYVSNCVGTGPIPRPKHPDKAKRKQIIALFDRWSKVCTPNRKLDFYGACAAAVRAERADGESFTRLRRRRPDDGLPVALQLQLFEADLCPLDYEDLMATPGVTQFGITFDGIRQPVFYHLYKVHPQSRESGIEGLETHPVPANEIVHMFEVRRAGQERGYPWMTPAMLPLYDIKQLVDASLMRQKISNLLSVWISRGQGSGGLTSLANETPAETGAEGRYETTFGPGTVNYTSGETPTFLNPPDAGQNFRDFLNSMLRSVARALGLTYEQLTGDLTGVNFASSRAGVVEMRRLMEQRQYFLMIHQFCRPVWDAWIRIALIDGNLWKGAAAEWAEHPEWFECDWMPPAWPYVDPVKDLQATLPVSRSAPRAATTPKRSTSKTSRITTAPMQKAWSMIRMAASRSVVDLNQAMRRPTRNRQSETWWGPGVNNAKRRTRPRTAGSTNRTDAFLFGLSARAAAAVPRESADDRNERRR
jgi:lambda family phage portal protein